jgi:hypothetical protein
MPASFLKNESSTFSFATSGGGLDYFGMYFFVSSSLVAQLKPPSWSITIFPFVISAAGNCLISRREFI